MKGKKSRVQRRTFLRNCIAFFLKSYKNIKKFTAKIIIFFLYFYRYTVSPLLGPRCRFYPSCSCYAIAAIQNHGIIQGLFLTIKRLLKCHPWHPGGVDSVPSVKK